MVKYSVRVIKFNPTAGIVEELQNDVFQSSKLKVAYQRRVSEGVLKDDLKPIFEHAKWSNDILDDTGAIDPIAQIDMQDQSNLRCSKIAYGENGDHWLLTVQATDDDAEVTVKTRTTSNAEQKEFQVIIKSLEGDEATVVSEKTVRYASENGVKHFLKESGEYTVYDEDKWKKYPGGGIYRDGTDGTILVIKEVKPEGTMDDGESQ